MIATVKSTIKYLLAILLYYSGLLALFSSLRKILFNRSKFTIVMYHRVLDDNDEEKEYLQPGLYVSRQVFEKQIAFLSKKYNLISLKELSELLINKQPISPNSLVITFDDGWRDNYSYAYPILKKYRAPAIIFLTTDYIDTNKAFWFLEASIMMTYNKLSRAQLGQLIAKYESEKDLTKALPGGKLEEANFTLSDRDWFIENLKQLDPKIIPAILKELSVQNKLDADTIKENRSMLTWEEVIEMNNNGIDFGSHGCSHRIMPALTDAEIERELIESKRIIEEKLGREINLFAYPNGDYSNHIRDLVLNSGYICALATKDKKEPESDTNIFSLKRVNVHDGVSVGPTGEFSPAMFSFHILRNS